MTEKIEVVVARIDENVKHIKKEIKCIQDDCDAKMLESGRKFLDHENRIRDNERFKQRGYGAIGLLVVGLGVVMTIVGWIVFA